MNWDEEEYHDISVRSKFIFFCLGNGYCYEKKKLWNKLDNFWSWMDDLLILYFTTILLEKKIKLRLGW